MANNEKSVISNTALMSLFILIGSICTVVLLLLDIPKGIVLALIISASLILFTIYPMYLIYKSDSLAAIDKYVIRNRKKILFRYAYALAYGNSQEIEEAIKALLEKYKQKEMQTVYGANLALHQKDIGGLMKYAKQMTKPDFEQYYLGIAYALSGKESLAKNCLTNITTPWMLHSLQATIAFQRQDLELFQVEAKKAVHNATGLQKYTTYHILNRKLS